MIKNFIAKFSFLAALTSTVAADSHWPMSGGPNGNWQIKTEKNIPIKWSVRTGKNIKWRTELPEGGQSGIAVWGKHVFLTINPELDTPKHEVLSDKFNKLKTQYDVEYKATLQKLKDTPEYLAKQTVIKKAQQAWNKEWKEQSKNLNGPQKRNLKKKMEKDQLGQDLKNAQIDLFR